MADPKYKKLQTIHTTKYGGRRKDVNYNGKPKKLQTVHDTKYGGDRSGVNYGRPALTQLKSNIKGFNKKYKLDVGYAPHDGTLRIGKDNYHIEGDLNKSPGQTLKKIFKKILDHEGIKITRKNSEEVIEMYRKISESIEIKEGGLEKLATPTIIALSITSLLLLFSQSNITGNIISEISPGTSGIGLTVCLVGIIGLTLFKKIKKQLF